MNPWLFFGVALLLVVLAACWPRWRRRRVLDAPFPGEWDRLLRRNSVNYRRLPAPDRERLQRRILVFLHDKHFTGCAGLEVTDEMRVTVAAEACLLVLNRGGDAFPALRWILLYPTGFVVDREAEDEDGLVTRETTDMDGESWDRSKVILAWDQALAGARGKDPGRNLVHHEFAHQLDAEAGDSDGIPVLGDPEHEQEWRDTVFAEYDALCAAAERGEPTVLDPYGAEHPAEFFAVATEAFFQQTAALAEHHPGLFELMRRYYGSDPRTWRRAARVAPRAR